MHPGIVCFQGEEGCSWSIGRLQADQLVDLFLIGCIIEIESNIKAASALMFQFDPDKEGGIYLGLLCVFTGSVMYSNCSAIREASDCCSAPFKYV